MNIFKRLRMWLDVVVAFCFIFSFPCIYIFRSSLIALPLIFAFVFFNQKARQKVMRMLFQGFSSKMLKLIIFIIIYSLIWTVFFGENDWEIGRMYITQMLFIIGVIFLYAYVSSVYGALDVIKFMFNMFLLQSVIQIFAYIYQPFADLVHFISPLPVEDFVDFRGLALSGVRFFGLSVVYSFVIVYYIYFFGHRFKWYDIVMVAIYILGGLFTARSFFLGVGAAAVVLFFVKGRFVLVFKVVGNISIGTAAALAVVPGTLKERIYDNLFPWLFEFYYTYLDTGTISTRSTSALDSMYFAMPIRTFLIGDGRYTDRYSPMHYYMFTDAGYMRQILFGGVFCLLIKLYYNYCLILPIFQYKASLAKLFGCLVAGMLLLFQYKGDVLGGLTLLTASLFFMGLGINEHNLLQKRKKLQELEFPAPPAELPFGTMPPYVRESGHWPQSPKRIS